MEFNLIKNLQTKYYKIIVILIILCMCSVVTCRPSNEEKHPGAIAADTENSQEGYEDLKPGEYEKIKKCNNNMELMELCMRCAKVTKSNLVYPMCCGNVDDVTKWCEDYVYYGIR